MLPASRTVEMRKLKTMRTAVEKADAVVQAGVQFPDGRGLLEMFMGLNAWCKVTVLRLKDCSLGEGGGRALADILRVNTTLAKLELGWNRLGKGGGRALAETLCRRLNTTLTSLDLSGNGLRKGGGRALAETLRFNTTVALLDLYFNRPGEVSGGRALAEALRLNLAPRLRRSTLATGLGEGGGRALAETGRERERERERVLAPLAPSTRRIFLPLPVDYVSPEDAQESLHSQVGLDVGRALDTSDE
jgi:hypothetical protein